MPMTGQDARAPDLLAAVTAGGGTVTGSADELPASTLEWLIDDQPSESERVKREWKLQVVW